MASRISRRAFLKLSAGLTAAALARPPHITTAAPIRLGRITNTLRPRDKPALTAREGGWLARDSVVTIAREAVGEWEFEHNKVWYETEAGWVHSGYVQPVRDAPNKPILDIPEDGCLAEVTVPVAQAWHDTRQAAYKFYYATTHWVTQAIADDQGIIWYRVLDDRYDVYYFVEAQHLRPVTAEEVAPLSPEVTDKRIQVDLARQRLTAYEKGKVVLSARIATGRPGVATPTGAFRVERKRPSRHMAANDGGGNGFDLPGVPWVSYFYWTGVALHGTYWHNDYGRPRSRGCVNLTPDDAKWLYRWTMPVVPVGESYVRDNGTELVVI